ncbi:DUF1214 domain-containing protein [Methylocella sp.]|uniref:DUF1214 domain-containing protein n=1 Tax=Methylocella sp. TaxID=1978226 RepID=UPI0035B276C3
MLLLGKYLLVLVAGLCLGLAATALTLQTGFGFGATRAGPWVAFARRDGAGLDPYARATFAHTGEIPLGATEGLSFLAHADSDGGRLDARCDYIVSGRTPAARRWTLSALSPEGRLLPNAAERYGFTSSELLRDARGGFRIVLSRHARPGNWTPLPQAGPFALMLRLYESEFSASSLAFDAQSLPTITRGDCS